ncbi:MAG: putative ABC transporter permease [Oscillospiraceae bacterium]|nr:putative ABC transporter permease [Oscillospiraceae bacterium]
MHIPAARIKEYTAAFLSGGIIYALIEILFRGYTYWSMALTGGICMVLMYRHYTRHPNEGLLTKCLVGMLIITSMELISGVILNIILRQNVWDYSDMYLNFIGQICPTFCAAWFLLSVPAAFLTEFISSRSKAHEFL